MAKKKAVYKSYLLRLWCKNPDDGVWRGMVQTVNGENERHHFANLDELIQFLMALKTDASN